MPVTATATSAPRRRRAPAAIAAAASAEEGAPRAGDVGGRGRHETAGGRLRGREGEPAGAGELEDEFLDRALVVLGEDLARKGVAQRAGERGRALLRLRLGEEVDVDLEAAGAD